VEGRSVNPSPDVRGSYSGQDASIGTWKELVEGSYPFLSNLALQQATGIEDLTLLIDWTKGEVDLLHLFVLYQRMIMVPPPRCMGHIGRDSRRWAPGIQGSHSY